MKIMAMAIFFFLGFGSYDSLAAPCSADAKLTNFHQIESNKFFFAFDVSSTQCTAYACRGYVKFAIKYHFRSGGTSGLTDNALVSYTVEKSNSSGHTIRKLRVSAFLPTTSARYRPATSSALAQLIPRLYGFAANQLSSCARISFR